MRVALHRYWTQPVTNIWRCSAKKVFWKVSWKIQRKTPMLEFLFFNRVVDSACKFYQKWGYDTAVFLCTSRTFSEQLSIKHLREAASVQLIIDSSLFQHCLKSVQIWSFFWSVFSCIRTEYSSNTGKYGPEKPPYLDTFHAVQIFRLFYSEKGLTAEYCSLCARN